MIRAAGKYADGWFPGTTRALEYGEQLTALRTAASDAGRDPMAITPASIRFILTGRTRDEIDEIDEIQESPLVRLFALNAPAKDWALYGAEHPLGPDFAGVQDLIPQLIDEETALSYVSKGPRELIEDVFVVGLPDEIVDQLAESRDHGLRSLVVGNMGALHPKLPRTVSAAAPYVKLLRRLRRL